MGPLIGFCRHRATCWINQGNLAKTSTRWFSSAKDAVFPRGTQVVFVSTLMPEPHATAAGVRTEVLLRLLSQSQGVERVHYLTSASLKKDMSFTPADSPLHFRQATYHELEQDHRVEFAHVPPNQSKAMESWLSNNIEVRDNVLVIFDRFYAEEMFSFQFHDHLENASLVLDMQDFHSLRKTRENAVAQAKAERLMPATSALPQLGEVDLLRELASIQRCDLSLVCSSFEHEVLMQKFKITPSKLFTAPLLHRDTDTARSFASARGWHERRDLCFLGNFRHTPNADAVLQLERLWPLMQKQLPEGTKMHVYGPYHGGRPKTSRLKGFHYHGYCTDIAAVLSKCRLLVAPLQFGAGLKGKIVEAWRHGLPVVTTSIGSEGLSAAGGSFAGIVADTDTRFVNGVADLYLNATYWHEAQANMPKLLSRLGPGAVVQALADLVTNREERRETDVQRAIMWHTSQQNTKHLSRYIECRSQLRALESASAESSQE